MAKKQSKQQGAGLCPLSLRCEYREAPMGIDVKRPRLSWLLSAEARCQHQSAYQILVATSPDLLTASKADLWNSGKVRSDAMAQIEYTGRPLRSRMDCYWTVRVWDGEGNASAWAEISCWTMGLLKPQDWQASWIGYDQPLKEWYEKFGDPNAQPDKKDFLPAPRYLRRAFKTKGEIRRATVYTTALGAFNLYLNGRRVFDDYFNPGWTDYHKRVYYRSYDVTEMLCEGDNAIGSVLADGWYAGYVGFAQFLPRDKKMPVRHHYGDKTRLLMQMHVEYADGSEEVIATDGRWRATTGAEKYADFLAGEFYDARKEMQGWSEPGFDDKDWVKVNKGTKNSGVLKAAPHQPVRVIERFKPIEVTQPRPGVYLFNLGQNFAGVVQLSVNERRGKKIVVRHGEQKTPDGELYTENLRSARAIDTYICKGGGTETWSPRYTFHGFQYVEVSGLSEAPGEDTLVGLALSSAAPSSGSFKCSDKLANQLYSNICWTQWANFIDVPTDCPQRDERLGWSGDAQIYIRTATYNNDVSAFFTKWCQDYVDGQLDDDSYPDVAPRIVVPAGGAGAWAEAGMVCPYTVYQVYGDKRILETHYQSMKRFVAFCKKDSKGLIRKLRQSWFHPDYGDWLSINADTPPELLKTAYFALTARIMARTADILGKTADAERYHNLFDRIRAAFNKAFVAEDGKIKGETQTGYVLALAFDLLDDEKRALAADYLVEDIRERGWHLSTGFVGTKDLMTTLSAIGRTDVAYRLFHNKTFPSWGFSIAYGATSIWERWNGWMPEQGFGDTGMNSFAHYSFGAVAEWMFKVIGGIDTDGPAYRKLMIAPQPGGKLKSAKVSYDSISGPISSEWKLRGGVFDFKLSIPANTTATVRIPASKRTAVTESGRTLARAEGVEFIDLADGWITLEVGSGDYHFVSKGV